MVDEVNPSPLVEVAWRGASPTPSPSPIPTIPQMTPALIQSCAVLDTSDDASPLGERITNEDELHDDSVRPLSTTCSYSPKKNPQEGNRVSIQALISVPLPSTQASTSAAAMADPSAIVSGGTNSRKSSCEMCHCRKIRVSEKIENLHSILSFSISFSSSSSTHHWLVAHVLGFSVIKFGPLAAHADEGANLAATLKPPSRIIRRARCSNDSPERAPSPSSQLHAQLNELFLQCPKVSLCHTVKPRGTRGERAASRKAVETGS